MEKLAFTQAKELYFNLSKMCRYFPVYALSEAVKRNRVLTQTPAFMQLFVIRFIWHERISVSSS